MFRKRLFEHLRDVSSLRIERAEAFRPANKFTMIDPFLSSPRDI